MALNQILANFYERDLRKLIEEVNLFKNEEDLWSIQGSIPNPAGNLVLHIIGGLNHLVGATLSRSGYVRDREFTEKSVGRKYLVIELEALISMINKTFNALTVEEMLADYPLVFDDMKRSNNYVLVQLLVHLNYHLGQVNYLRRIFEQPVKEMDIRTTYL